MNPELLEQFRLCLLQSMRAAAPHALPISHFALGVRMAGFRNVDPNQVKAELQYLGDKKLAVAEDKPVSPENAEWRITAEGRDFLAKAGL